MVAQMETCGDKAEASTSLQTSSGDNNNNQRRGPIVLNLDEICCNSLSTGAYYSDASSSELIEQHDLRVMMLQPSMDDRLTYLKCFVRNLQNTGSGVEKIAKSLSIAECWLSDVILLRNVALTRAFLQAREKLSDDESQCFVPPEIVLLRNLRLKLAFPSVKHSIIDGDSRASVDFVVSTLDVDNAKVIFKYGPCKDDRVRYFFDTLATMATKQLNLQALKVFAKQAIEWNILDDDASRLVELKIFQKASMSVIDVFLKFKIDAHVDKLFKRNIFTALFGNPNVSLGYLKKLKFDVNARGSKDFTALHYAMQNSLIDKVKFLLDCGADPNSMNWRNETPLVLALNEPQVNSIDNKRCAELLLQFGADPFSSSWDGKSFDSCIQSNNFTLSTRYLMELAMAYARVYKASGAANLSDDYYNALKGIDMVVKENDCLFGFYMKCKQQIRLLKADRIRNGLSMFTIVSTTGDKLVHLLDENDRRIITDFIVKYRREHALCTYYLDALKEHMRQFRRLVTCKNRAILALSEKSIVLANCHVVLDKIVSYMSTKDLLAFQLGSEKSACTPSCGLSVNNGIKTASNI